MALVDKKSILTKGLRDNPVFRPFGVLINKLSLFTPNFPTITGVSQGYSSTTKSVLSDTSTPPNNMS